MAMEEITLDQNAAAIAQASGNDTAAQIDEIDRRASAQVQTMQSEEGRLSGGSASGGDNAASLLIDAGIDAILPGAKLMKTVAEGAIERAADTMPSNGGPAKPVSMDDHITGSFKKAPLSGAGLISSVNNVTNSLFGRAATDKFGTDELTGGMGKKNETRIPTDESAANQLSQSMQKVYGLKAAHAHVKESVLAARQTHTAALGAARQMAPGFDLSNGPRMNATQILQEADQYRKETAQA